jgi:hypothetical protein
VPTLEEKRVCIKAGDRLLRASRCGTSPGFSSPMKGGNAPEWTRTTTGNNLHKALNLVHRRHMRPSASRSSVLCGFADASDASDEMTCARDVPRR